VEPNSEAIRPKGRKKPVMQINHQDMAEGPIAAEVAIASTPKIAQNEKSTRSQKPNTFFLSILNLHLAAGRQPTVAFPGFFYIKFENLKYTLL
jgi:hypothetical protein